MERSDLDHLMESHEEEFASAVEALLAKDYRKAAAVVGSIALAVMSGHPGSLVVAPLAGALLKAAFESAADRHMRERMKAFRAEDDRGLFAQRVAALTSELIDEAVVTLAKLEHRTAEQVGRMREEFREFRETLLRLQGDGRLPAPVPPPEPGVCTLPTFLTPPFVGRKAEWASLDAWRERGDSRVMVVHGPPGVGKTTLAVDWAQTQATAFPGGALLHLLPQECRR